jgi:hypothetical protein
MQAMETIDKKRLRSGGRRTDNISNDDCGEQVPFFITSLYIGHEKLKVEKKLQNRRRKFSNSENEVILI